jgi:hypothetical protein
MKNFFRKPGTGLKKILRVLTNFPTWVGGRTTMWKGVFPKFPWDKVCGKDTKAEENAQMRFRAAVSAGIPLAEVTDIEAHSDVSDTESFTTDLDDDA